jgi:hypothetical protein
LNLSSEYFPSRRNSNAKQWSVGKKRFNDNPKEVITHTNINNISIDLSSGYSLVGGKQSYTKYTRAYSCFSVQ